MQEPFRVAHDVEKCAGNRKPKRLRVGMTADRF